MMNEHGTMENEIMANKGVVSCEPVRTASGAVLTTRLLHSMKRDGLKRGVVTLCIGGGQGIALALEMIG
jgi:acetyl-CoA C-acetyltransferase